MTPPFTASAPDDPLLPQLDEPGPSTKRQRVLPPSLDGQTRGWAHPQSPSTWPSGDSDEEYVDEDDSRAYDTYGPGGVDAGPPTVVYKEVNHFLRNLHAEHQHRMFFASTSFPQPLAYPSQASHDCSHLAHTSQRPKHTPSQQAHTYIPIRSGEDDNESQLVHHRYEHPNRLLRDLFLSRRRELSDAPPG
ncbi:hypothetical protein K488DRAFT_83509 [Vararia minispora EC-137]|uniref:Uncharacterized protein n=1 Tax=Vararia minispora EC-137 TaxID=1314806 RepID=A0ACB8QTA5_9AGAM|nr:hypothetical protein K488DRAFT_83509 [Vararia minispora EC-137]